MTSMNEKKSHAHGFNPTSIKIQNGFYANGQDDTKIYMKFYMNS